MTGTRLSRSVEETREIGRELAAELRPDRALLLVGALGAGKTALVRGLADGLGVDPAEVQSPTFTLMRAHRGRDAGLVHFDLYRLAPGDLAATGFEEILLGPGVKAVEWAERLPFAVPGALIVGIRRRGEEREVRRMTQEELETMPPEGG